MKIENKKINFEDARGTITDIFVKEPQSHCTIIFSKKGAIRGNHYHKQSVQSDFIVSGKMQIFSKKLDSDKVESKIVGPNTLITWDFSEVHAFTALEDSIFITFVNGVRGGDDYEKDTFRVDKPLQSYL